MGGTFRARGGGWVIIQFALMLAVLALGPAWRSGWGGGGTMTVGGLLLALSALTGLWGVRDLGANRTPYPSPNDGAPLVTGGIYGWLRHPLYTSVMAFGFGWALLWGSTPALAAAGVCAVFLDRKARHEERLLRSRYPDYDAYQRRVRRFVPGVY